MCGEEKGSRISGIVFLVPFAELRITRELCFMVRRGKRIEPSLCLDEEFAHGDTLYVGVYLGPSTAFGVKCLWINSQELMASKLKGIGS